VHTWLETNDQLVAHVVHVTKQGGGGCLELHAHLSVRARLRRGGGGAGCCGRQASSKQRALALLVTC
jgi:hypothetical protein